MPSQNCKAALLRMTEYCSRSEKCRSDIREKLRRFDLEPDEVTEVVEWLVAEKFIDESRYASAFVRDKFRFNKWGKIKLSYMLRVKGIPDEIIQASLAEIPGNSYHETLLALLKSKARNRVADSEVEQLSRLVRFAQSHGFEGELSYRLARQVIGKKQ